MVWAMPAVGEELTLRGDELLRSLESALGPERWPLVERLLDPGGIESLRWVLHLDAGKERQEIGVWLRNENGRFLVDYGFSLGSAYMTSGGVALDLFKPGSDSKLLMTIGTTPLADCLQQRLQAWIEAQAQTYLAEGVAQ
jgi:hypothetical protein